MEQIIQKAIEGGFRPSDFPHKNDVFDYAWAKQWYSGNYKAMVMEPSFFQALGKACGWENGVFDIPVSGNNWTYYVNNNHAFNLKVRKEAWNHYACRFHEINLTSGWDAAVEYLSSLIK